VRRFVCESAMRGGQSSVECRLCRYHGAVTITVTGLCDGDVLCGGEVCSLILFPAVVMIR